MGLQVWNNWLPNLPAKVGWKRESKAEAVTFLMSPGNSPVKVRTGGEEQWFSLENAWTQLLLGDKQGELVFPKAWGGKKVIPWFHLFSDFSPISQQCKCILTCCVCALGYPLLHWQPSLRMGWTAKMPSESFIYTSTHPAAKRSDFAVRQLPLCHGVFSAHCKPSDAFHCFLQLVALR